MDMPSKFCTEHFEFVNYTLLSEEESKTIWNARNNPMVSQWMDNKEIIPWDAHCRWVSNLRNCNDRVYYAVMGGVKLLVLNA